MTPYYQDERATIYHVDCREVVPELEPVDAVVTDPPYGLEFMGKDWDRLGDIGKASHAGPSDRDGSSVFGRQRIAHNASANKKCRRCDRWAWDYPDRKCVCAAPDFPNVKAHQARAMQDWFTEHFTAILAAMKPGAHLLAFGGTRTHHRLMCAIEDAGFEIRDCVMWVYGSGFPKSLDVSKAIDKAAGVEREKVRHSNARNQKTHGGGRDGALGATRPFIEEAMRVGFHDMAGPIPVTEAAKQWDGWGTALKPAVEYIPLARKPLEGTVAENVLKYGTGAINIDACRIGMRTGNESGWTGSKESENSAMSGANYERKPKNEAGLGRWPANLIHDGSDEVLALFPESDHARANKTPTKRGRSVATSFMSGGSTLTDPGDSGSAARFFYCAKASSADRGDETLAALPLFDIPEETFTNDHPTVKPTALMQYLLRLVLPPGGVVLDPFMGSGSTLVAAAELGIKAIGVELDEHSCETAAERLRRAAGDAKIYRSPK